MRCRLAQQTISWAERPLANASGCFAGHELRTAKLHGQVRHFVHRRQALADHVGGYGRVADHADNGRTGFGPTCQTGRSVIFVSPDCSIISRIS